MTSTVDKTVKSNVKIESKPHQETGLVEPATTADTASGMGTARNQNVDRIERVEDRT